MAAVSFSRFIAPGSNKEDGVGIFYVRKLYGGKPTSVTYGYLTPISQ